MGIVFQRKTKMSSLLSKGAIQEGEYDDGYPYLWNVHLSQNRYMLRNKDP